MSEYASSIRARIPQDNGKRLRCSHSHSVLVRDCECDFCDNPAVVVLEGERDSFGWDPMILCQACLDEDDDPEA